MSKIFINNKSFFAKNGEMVIEVADRNGIYIPRFCYHKKLSLAANCRMCLVEIKNARKPSPACSTPIIDDMKIFTNSPITISYQKKIMEFLLINHPLDCPICDQGGECELQDTAMAYGSYISQYSENKRTFKNEDLGSLISTNMTRCIQCTRCVRFSEEIAGEKELNTIGRQDTMMISTYVEKTINSELSGNMIDLCPVGALTSKPFEYKARSWELLQYPSISCADSLGSNIYVHVKNNSIMRVIPKENSELNETWLGDNDRFYYTAVNNNRLSFPEIKHNGKWMKVSWDIAFKHIKNIITTPQQHIASLVSNSLPTEELYLINKLVSELGSNNINHQLKQGSDNKYIQTGLDCTLLEIEKSDCILLIGSFLRKEVPLINYRVRKAFLNKAKIFSINSKVYNFNYDVKTILTEAKELVKTLAQLMKAISSSSVTKLTESKSLKYIISVIDFIPPEITKLAYKIIKAKNPILIMGFDCILNKDFTEIYAIFLEIKRLLTAKGGVISIGSNSQGALLSNIKIKSLHKKIKKDKQLSLDKILSSNNNTIILHFGIEPELDSILGKKILKKLSNKINIIFSAYYNKHMYEYGDIIIPITTHFESGGSFINIIGLEQRFKSVIDSYKDSKPLWQVLSKLRIILNIDNIEYKNIDQIYNEYHSIKTILPKFSHIEIIENCLKHYKLKNVGKNELSILPSVSMYKISSILRNSEALQNTKDVIDSEYMRVSYTLAKEKGLLYEKKAKLIISSNKYYIVPILIDKTLTHNTIILPFQLLYIIDDDNNIIIESLNRGN